MTRCDSMPHQASARDPSSHRVRVSVAFRGRIVARGEFELDVDIRIGTLPDSSLVLPAETALPSYVLLTDRDLIHVGPDAVVTIARCLPGGRVVAKGDAATLGSSFRMRHQRLKVTFRGRDDSLAFFLDYPVAGT